MRMNGKTLQNASRITALSLGFLGAAVLVAGTPAALAQAAPAKASKLGTVKAISGSTITVAPATGDPVTVTVADGAKVLQLDPGSTDLKTAKPAQLSDIAVGDRVLATGTDGSAANTVTAARVILMKSGDIAQKNAAQQADWQKRGSGGIVNAVSGSTLTITAGTKKIEVATTPKTIFRRYAGDSVKFEDAVPGSLSQLQAGDQLRVRGDKSADGSSIQADEVVSGSFKNLSGKIDKIDAATGAITLKDLATKKVMTINVTANSVLHRLPERAAMMFAAANGRGGRPAGGGGENGDQGGDAPAPAAGGGDRQGGGRGAGGPGGGRGMDLSQMVARLPVEKLADLKQGEAVMIVASEPTPGSPTVTAITVLSGVEPILTANPSGGMTLSPWSMGGGGGEGGGGI